MRDIWVHLPRFLAKAGNAVAALFRGAEFELKQRLVPSVHNAEIIRHGDEIMGPRMSARESAEGPREAFLIGHKSVGLENQLLALLEL